MLARAERLHREVFTPPHVSQRGVNWEPPTDVLETEDAVLIFVALPGVDPEKVEVAIHNGVLLLAGARPLPADALIVVPVRNTVLFPEIVFPITVGRPSSIAAAQQAVREQRQILLVLQRDPEMNDPAPVDLHNTGTVANIVRYVTSPEGGHHLICQGVQRFRITEFVEGYPFLLARGLHIAEPTPSGPEIEARFLLLQEQVREVLDLLPRVPPEMRQTVEATSSPGMLADLAATYLDATPQEKQDILETSDLVPRLDKVSKLLAHRLEVLRLSAEIEIG